MAEMTSTEAMEYYTNNKNCSKCELQDLSYGINYLKYGPNFQLYTTSSKTSEDPYNVEMQYCVVEEPKRIARSNGCAGPYIKTNNQKRIWNTVRVPASLYTTNKACLNVYNGRNSWNRQSDRNTMSITNRNVPSRGNSTKTSITRCRPGSCSAKGKGVDIKHNSYDRYLAKLKGRGPAKTEKYGDLHPKQGNKTRFFGIAYSNSCLC